LKQLRAVVENAARSQYLRRANAELHRRLDERFGFEGVIGNSPQMHDVVMRLQRIAPTDATVLIQGETGTGKELVAKAIHQNSPRKKRPFVPLNCAALSEHILESELFGHIRGAFTDASSDRQGKFEYADGGTLFLDEVGDMPIPTQIKLLRVLESGEITRVGSNEPIKVNVRILSATNRDLEKAIAEGTFREDLYHRLKVVTITLPRLADRREDIPLLIDYFVKEHSKRHQKTVRGISTAARRRLMTYDWPGNVRQLRNVIESMVVVDYDEVLDVDDLPSELAPVPVPGEAASAAGANGLHELIGKPISELEALFIGETLKATGGNREEAAAILGIGERTLYRKIKEYGLS
jgi:two-component system response regulator HydG